MKIPADIQKRLFRKLQIIDDATCDADLQIPPGNQFEKLKCKLTDKHNLSVNVQWCLVFTWSSELGEATNISLGINKYR